MEKDLNLVTVIELDVLLADSSVEGYPGVCHATFGVVVLPGPDEYGVYAAKERESDGKSDDGNEHPVIPHPEDELDIVVVPAVSKVVGEEAPGMVVVLIREEDANAVIILRAGVVVMAPDDAQKKRSSGSHDGNVRQYPLAVVVRQGVDCLEEEFVAGDSAHGVV